MKGANSLSAWTVWLVIAIVMVILEVLTFTFFLLWLGIGALIAAGIAFYYPYAYGLQILVAVVVSIVFIFIVRPFFVTNGKKSNGFQDVFETIVGRRGEVVEAIPKEGLGIVKIGTEQWSAKSEVALAKGESIVVVGRHSTVLEVNRRKDE